MIILLLIVIGLVMWSLHLMRAAFNHREFALMLAGTLVAISAAGVIVVYFLMEGYLGYMTHAVRYQLPLDDEPEVIGFTWSELAEADTASSQAAIFESVFAANTLSPHLSERSGVSYF